FLLPSKRPLRTEGPRHDGRVARSEDGFCDTSHGSWHIGADVKARRCVDGAMPEELPQCLEVAGHACQMKFAGEVTEKVNVQRKTRPLMDGPRDLSSKCAGVLVSLTASREQPSVPLRSEARTESRDIGVDERGALGGHPDEKNTTAPDLSGRP